MGKSLVLTPFIPAHLGANSGGANGVYWVEVLGRQDGGVLVRNIDGQVQTPHRNGRTGDRTGPALSAAAMGRRAALLGRAAGPYPAGPGSRHADGHRRGRDAEAVPAHAGLSGTVPRFARSRGRPIAAIRDAARSTRCTTSGRTRSRRSRWCGGGWIGGSTRRWSKRRANAEARRLQPRPAAAARDVRAWRRAIPWTRPITFVRFSTARRSTSWRRARRSRRQEFRHAGHVRPLADCPLSPRRSAPRRAIGVEPSGARRFARFRFGKRSSQGVASQNFARRGTSTPDGRVGRGATKC